MTPPDLTQPQRLDLEEGKRLLVVPREKHPLVAVVVAVQAAPPHPNPRTFYVDRIHINVRSHRAYHFVTEEDAKWILQVIDEILLTNPAPTPMPIRRRSRRSSPAASVTSASAAASNTSTAAASARQHRHTPPS